MAGNKTPSVKIDKETLKTLADHVIDRLRTEEISFAKSRYDKRRANVKLLLREYGALVDHCRSAIYDIEDIENEDSLATILDLMSGNRIENFRIESIKKSAIRTRIIIEHINEMVDLYRIYCEKSPKSEDVRRYRVIYFAYLADDTMSIDEIADMESTDKRTIYRDIDIAAERLTALIFGIDGLYFMDK